ncbi:hypothetical protein GLOIN_2v1606421 [Rhizophagus irregularis DAOM 181602=DAOM 197198]|uniref:Uncharacterized protein n=1 Tax=Rhizophagus irregularis (strain DAOM 181602 / DAOM 197198 / MUCL 43194) TaxID=747089 RepID=A0A2P4Q1C0_RHIID|nr:hypothetical protein GLOIN_2v1606421 [Rhizophagus irregularis DAOM 181602=DAOM 197198]POG71455.1 hypothetical protein GLOIN_2v1606421 [Rhizophagus irregularis DAOM 181602=DAOM 197198]|eukprot:XP_025178321.1 hypothetical protein GLOIN_2v1606421 [Rhizophagus irregularis DAOM 181602=DAOM 197198]
MHFLSCTKDEQIVKEFIVTFGIFLICEGFLFQYIKVYISVNLTIELYSIFYLFYFRLNNKRV